MKTIHLAIAALLLETRQLMKLSNVFDEFDSAEDNEVASDLIIFEDNLHPQNNNLQEIAGRNRRSATLSKINIPGCDQANGLAQFDSCIK